MGCTHCSKSTDGNGGISDPTLTKNASPSKTREEENSTPIRMMSSELNDNHKIEDNEMIYVFNRMERTFQNVKKNKYDRNPEDIQKVDPESILNSLPCHHVIKRAPPDRPPPDLTLPDEDLFIEHVYGYNSEDSKYNALFSFNGDIVYPTSSLVVIQNPDSFEQRIIGGNKINEISQAAFHTDTIISMAISHDRKKLLTGQVGNNPILILWDLETCKMSKRIILEKNSRGTGSCAFSWDDKYIAFNDLGPFHNVYVYDTKGGKVFSTRIGSIKPAHINWSSKFSDYSFAIVGPKNLVVFYLMDSKELIEGNIPQKKTTSVDMECVTFDSQGIGYVGGSNGKIYKWINRELAYSVGFHQNKIVCLVYQSEKLISGGADSIIYVIDSNKFCKLNEIKTVSIPISLDYNGDILLYGMIDGTIAQISEKDKISHTIVNSHYQGELWGLENYNNFILTSGDDNSINVWDSKELSLSKKTLINREIGTKPSYGSSPLSLNSDNQCSRAIAINKINSHVAIATNQGRIQIRESVLWIDKIINELINPQRWVECISYSPNGTYLAVGSHDSVLYLYNVKEKYKLANSTFQNQLELLNLTGAPITG